MQKTKLGITIAVFGAALYLVAYLGGTLAAVVLAGYVLLMEENDWLKWTAIRAVALALAFGLLSAAVGLIPDVAGLLRNIINLFAEEPVYWDGLNKVMNIINGIISIVKTVFFLLLAVKALTMKTIKLPVVDDLVQKNM